MNTPVKINKDYKTTTKMAIIIIKTSSFVNRIETNDESIDFSKRFDKFRNSIVLLKEVHFEKPNLSLINVLLKLFKEIKKSHYSRVQVFLHLNFHTGKKGKELKLI